MTSFDRAQAAYDNATPEYLDEDRATYAADQCPRCHKDNIIGGWSLCRECDPYWCDECGDQAVCPECKGT